MDLSNQRFGEWKAVYPLHKNKRIYWHCVCDCGVERDVLQYSLTSGASTGCGHNTRKGNRCKDLTNMIFGELTVLEKTEERNQGAVVWKCKCNCGTIVFWPGDRLQQTKRPNCGCKKRENLVGQVFNKLTVIKEVESSSNIRKWLCQCECGNNTIVAGPDLKRGQVIGCGCGKSIGEYNIMKCLLENGILFKKEYGFKDLYDRQQLRYDFAILDEDGNVLRLIEFDGKQHQDINNKWYSLDIVRHDKMKNEYARNNNIPLVRIPYEYKNKITLDIILKDQFLL